MVTEPHARPDRQGAGQAATCFVIMPFGEKTSLDGKVVKFDDIYTFLLSPAIKAAGLAPVRCDTVEESGLIHRKMLEHIRDARVAVVDLSLLNANVFYELGVRHTLCRSVTVLVRRKGTSVPFNLAGLNVIEYDETDLASVARATSQISESITGGLADTHVDSLVFELLDLPTPPPVATRITRRQAHNFMIEGRRIGLSVLTGGIESVTDVDVWVNAENTNMQMARFYDWSISGVVRFLGAKRDVIGQVRRAEDDLVFNELTSIMAGQLSVPPATVIPTGPGMLAMSHNVKAVFHAAAVEGAVGEGYRPISNPAACITAALRLMDTPDQRAVGCRSIVFPLLGAGVRPQEVSGIANTLIEAAVGYVDNTPTTTVGRICFLAWNTVELDACLSALAGQSIVGPC